MDQKFRQLIELGAGKFEHIEPALIEHLEGTRCTLKSWAADQTLLDAGLYYLAYDTNGHFPSDEQRADIKSIIGEQVEQLIYLYFCCDKHAFYQQLDKTDEAVFYNRFTKGVEPIGVDLVEKLCELHTAINVDNIGYNPKYLAEHSAVLCPRFKAIQHFLSAAAKRKVNDLVNKVEQTTEASKVSRF